jgi:hypothetical protein
MNKKLALTLSSFSFFGMLWHANATMLPAASDDVQMDRCSPGEGGPRPLQDISGQMNSDLSILKTKGGIQEYSLTPDNSSVYYRNDASSIFKMNLGDGSQNYITDSHLPLSKVLDSKERYLLARNSGWAWDFRLAEWIRFLPDSTNVGHLFWHSDLLGRDWIYSISEETWGDETTHHIYRSRPNGDEGEEMCTVEGAHLATGHEFPLVFFYQTRKAEKGPLLSVYHLDVRTCRFKLQTDFLDPIAGKVLSVHRFEGLNSVAVQVDHPKKNLLWHRVGVGCDYYDIGRHTPMIPNRDLPVLATWAQNQGLQVVYLNEAKNATLLRNAPFDEISESDVSLTNDTHHLFVSPRPTGEKSKLLLELKLAR